MDVDSGRILASASKPSFDPNEMSGRLTPEGQRLRLLVRQVLDAVSEN